MILQGQEAVAALDAMQIAEGPCKGKSVLAGLRLALLTVCLEEGIVSRKDADQLMSEWGYAPGDLETLLRA
jgi:hypothetical protein